MSKAFTRESDETSEARPRRRELELPVGAQNYMTAAGARRLRQELDGLLTGEDAAPERVQELTDHLTSAEIVDPATLDHDQVRFGSTVTLVGEDGDAITYRIVGIAEAEPRQRWISWLSPLARSLLGARVGDLVTLRTPKGSEDLEVVRIAYDA